MANDPGIGSALDAETLGALQTLLGDRATTSLALRTRNSPEEPPSRTPRALRAAAA